MNNYMEFIIFAVIAIVILAMLISFIVSYDKGNKAFIPPIDEDKYKEMMNDSHKKMMESRMELSKTMSKMNRDMALKRLEMQQHLAIRHKASLPRKVGMRRRLV